MPISADWGMCMWAEERDGYHFQAIVYPYNQPKALVIAEQPSDDMLQYIHTKQIEQLAMDLAIVDCSFLRELPHVKYFAARNYICRLSMIYLPFIS